MRRPLIAVTAALMLAAICPMVAQSSDTNLLFQNQPVILGHVTGMTSHSVRVITPDGEAIPIEFDSRTVMAADMPAGMPVRVEFKLLDSGLYLAQRITPLEKGSLDWSALEARLMSRDSDHDVAQASYSRGGSYTRSMSADRSSTRHEVSSSNSGTGDGPIAATSSSSYDEQLPSSASELPWTLVMGLLLLIAAGFIWRARHRPS